MAKMGRFIGSTRTNKGAAARRMRRSKVSFVIEKDLSDYEEKNDRTFFTEIGRQAAINAINENKAMNIPVTFMEDGWVVRRMPQGNIEKIVEIQSKAGVSRERKLTKGTVLHVKKSR
jgi:hypothetical protein